MNPIKISTLILLLSAFVLTSHSSPTTQIETEKGWYPKVKRATTIVDWVGGGVLGASILSATGSILYHAHMNTPENELPSCPSVKLNGILLPLAIKVLGALILNQGIKVGMGGVNKRTEEVKIMPKF